MSDTPAQIKAAFFDIDGTLLPFGAKVLPESTVTALTALRQNGVRIFIATGRPPAHLADLPALKAVEWDGYVMMNGQYCFLADGTVLHQQAIDPAALRELCVYLETANLSVNFVGLHGACFNFSTEANAVFAQEAGQRQMELDEFLAQGPVYQLSAFLPQEIEAEFLRHCPGCIAVRWHKDFADILPAGGGKPTGLAYVLAHYGLAPGQAIAFGDSGNDAAMLEYAGIGVAMGNAWPAALQAADYITADVTDDGIEKALKHFDLI